MKHPARPIPSSPAPHGCRPGLGLLASVVLAGLLAGCTQGEAQQQNAQQSAEPPPAEVEVRRVTPRTVVPQHTYPARIRAEQEADVRARVEGEIVARRYEEGSRVKAGTMLFQIEPAPYEARVQQAEAERERARAQLAQAQREWKQIQTLYQDKYVSERQYDQARSAVELGQAEQARAEASLRAARIDLGYTQVTAPIDGVAGQRAVSEGNLVTPGTLLTTVRQLDPLHVLFSLPEADAAKRRRELAVVEGVPTPSGEQTVRVLLPDDTIYAQRGRVDYIAPNVEADTGTVQARALLPNPEGLLMPGQFLRVMLAGAPVENAITIPATALVEGPQGEIVYLVDERQQAVAQPVTVGQQLENGEVIITAGLRGGEQVVVGGLAGVQPGRALAPNDAAADPQEVAATAGPAKTDAAGAQ